MKKNTYFYIIIFILLISLPQINIQASTTDTLVAPYFAKKFGEKGDTLLEINYHLDNNKKIRLKEVFLVSKPEGEKKEIKVPLTLKNDNEVVTGDGLGEVIEVSLPKQRFKRATYTAKIVYLDLSKKGRKKKKDKNIARQKGNQNTSTGISLFQRVIPVWGHCEVSNILVSKGKKVKKIGKIAPWLLLATKGISLLNTTYHYGEARHAMKQRNQAEHTKHIRKANQNLYIFIFSYGFDLGWLTLRNQRQKAINNK